MQNEENKLIRCPKQINRQLSKLYAIIDETDSPDLKPQVVADFLGIDVTCFRMLVEKGKVPFAFGGRENSKANRITKIPKLALWNWVMSGQKLDV